MRGWGSNTMDKAKITISQRLLLTFSAVFLVVAAYLFFEVLQYRDDMLLSLIHI